MNNDARPDVMINQVANGVDPGLVMEGNWQLVNAAPGSGVRIDIRACYGMTQGYGAKVRAFIDGPVSYTHLTLPTKA